MSILAGQSSLLMSQNRHSWALGTRRAGVSSASLRTRAPRWPVNCWLIAGGGAYTPRLIIRSRVELGTFSLAAASLLVTLTILMSSLCSGYARRYHRRRQWSQSGKFLISSTASEEFGTLR